MDLGVIVGCAEGVADGAMDAATCAGVGSGRLIEVNLSGIDGRAERSAVTFIAGIDTRDGPSSSGPISSPRNADGAMETVALANCLNALGSGFVDAS